MNVPQITRLARPARPDACGVVEQFSATDHEKVSDA
jgi:hypothetical protein